MFSFLFFSFLFLFLFLCLFICFIKKKKGALCNGVGVDPEFVVVSVAINKRNNFQNNLRIITVFTWCYFSPFAFSRLRSIIVICAIYFSGPAQNEVFLLSLERGSLLKESVIWNRIKPNWSFSEIKKNTAIFLPAYTILNYSNLPEYIRLQTIHPGEVWTEFNDCAKMSSHCIFIYTHCACVFSCKRHKYVRKQIFADFYTILLIQSLVITTLLKTKLFAKKYQYNVGILMRNNLNLHKIKSFL